MNENSKNVEVVKENSEHKLNKAEFIKNLKSNFISTVKKVYINSLQREVGFREISVKEQKQLSRIMIDNENRKDVVYDAQCALINQVCLDDTFDIYKLTEFDKIKLLIVMYQTNMAKNDVVFKCENCGTENAYKLDYKNVLKRLDSFDISDKTFNFENDNWKFDFVVGYPLVKAVSEFYRSYAPKYRQASDDEIETLNNLINVDYVNMFIKKVDITNKSNNIVQHINCSEWTPSEIDEIFSSFPQDVLYVENGILNFVTEFIQKINKTFEQHKCAACGTISTETIDGSVENFL